MTDNWTPDQPLRADATDEQVERRVEWHWKHSNPNDAPGYRGQLLIPFNAWYLVARELQAATKAEYEPDASSGANDQMRIEKLSEKMNAAIQQWVKDNPEKIETALRNTLQDGVVEAMTQSLDRRFASVLPLALQNMRNNGLLPSGL